VNAGDRRSGRARLCRMGVRKDCRHYSTRTTPTGEVVQRCRMDVAEAMPFACPDDCIFFEPRSITDAGWQRLERPPTSTDDDT